MCLPPAMQSISPLVGGQKAAVDGAREALNIVPDVQQSMIQGNDGAPCRQAVTGSREPASGNTHGFSPAPGAWTMPAQMIPVGTHTASPVPWHWVFAGISCPVLKDKSYSRDPSQENK